MAFDLARVTFFFIVFHLLSLGLNRKNVVDWLVQYFGRISAVESQDFLIFLKSGSNRFRYSTFLKQSHAPTYHEPHLKLFTPLPSFLFRATKIFQTVLSAIHWQIYVRGQPSLPFAYYLVGRLYKLHAKNVIRIFKSHTTQDKNFWNSFRSFLGNCFPGTVALAEQCQWTMKLFKKASERNFPVRENVDRSRETKSSSKYSHEINLRFLLQTVNAQNQAGGAHNDPITKRWIESEISIQWNRRDFW